MGLKNRGCTALSFGFLCPTAWAGLQFLMWLKVGSEGSAWVPTAPAASWFHSTLGHPVFGAWLEIPGALL